MVSVIIKRTIVLHLLLITAARHRVVLWQRQFEYIFYLLHALPLCLKMLEGILHSLSFSRKKIIIQTYES